MDRTPEVWDYLSLQVLQVTGDRLVPQPNPNRERTVMDEQDEGASVAGIPDQVGVAVIQGFFHEGVGLVRPSGQVGVNVAEYFVGIGRTAHRHTDLEHG